MRNLWFRRDEDFGGLVAGIWCPRFGTGDAKEVLPLRKSRDEFERFGKFAGFVSREQESDPGTILDGHSTKDEEAQRT